LSTRAPVEAPLAEEQDGQCRFTLGQRIQFKLVEWIAPLLIRAIGVTLRVDMSAEEGSFTNVDDILPGIYPFWHRCVFSAAWVFRNRGFGVLTSLSRDGEFIARVIRRLGFVPLRGSSSRGGWRGLLQMQELVKAGGGAAFTIDGPRGPRYVAKRGPVLLARMTGVPITAFYLAVERGWVLKTWDATTIPQPFSRVYLRAARHIVVPADADEAALEQCHAEMQAALERVTAFAEAQYGHTPN